MLIQQLLKSLKTPLHDITGGTAPIFKNTQIHTSYCKLTHRHTLMTLLQVVYMMSIKYPKSMIFFSYGPVKIFLSKILRSWRKTLFLPIIKQIYYNFNWFASDDEDHVAVATVGTIKAHHHCSIWTFKSPLIHSLTHLSITVKINLEALRPPKQTISWSPTFSNHPGQTCIYFALCSFGMHKN